MACSPWAAISTRTASAPASPDISTVRYPPGQQTVVIEQSDITKAAAAVSPSVVTITSSTVPASDPVDAATGVGSGVIYDFDAVHQEGWILTNRHVVCGDGDLTVRLADGRQFPASTYGIDTLTDLAIIHVDDAPHPAGRRDR